MFRASICAAALWAVFSWPTNAQTAITREEAVKQLEKNYNEVPESRGITSNGSMMEVFVSPKGTWTLVITMPNGVIYVVAAGTDWQTHKQKSKRNPGNLRLDKTGFSI
jgi:hypothetical protein